MKQTRWWDIPGVLALVVVIPGVAAFVGLFAVLSFIVHGEWPTWCSDHVDGGRDA